MSDICPHCLNSVPNVYYVWQSLEYKTDFQMNCPKCNGSIQVFVEAIPEFVLEKPRPVAKTMLTPLTEDEEDAT